MLLHQEQGVISEAAVAARFTQDRTRPAGRRHQGNRIGSVPGERHGAVEIGPPLITLQRIHGVQQLGIVVGVAGIRTRVPCGINPRLPTQCRHHQAGVVRNGRMAAPAGGVTRFQQGILDEGKPVLTGLGNPPFRLGAQVEALAAQQCAEFAKLACIAAGQHQDAAFLAPHRQAIRPAPRTGPPSIHGCHGRRGPALRRVRCAGKHGPPPCPAPR